MSRKASLKRPTYGGRRIGLSSVSARSLLFVRFLGLTVLAATLVTTTIFAQTPDLPSKPQTPTGERPTTLPQAPPPREMPKPDVMLPPPRPLDPPPMGMNKCPPKPAGPQDLPLGSTPLPGPKTAEKINRHIDTWIDTEATIDLIAGRTRLLVLKNTPKRIQIADDSIAEYNLITKNQMSMQGRAIGVTDMVMWFEDPNDPTKEDILTFYVRVLPDPEVRHRLERVYKALQDQVNCAFPDSVICLHVVGDKLVVTGQAKDIAECAQILKILRNNANRPGGGGGGGGGGNGGHSGTARIPTDRQRPVRDPNNPSEQIQQPVLGGVEDYLIEGADWLVNMIKIPGEQTVNLKVTIAEVNRSAARSIGLNFTVLNSEGVPVFANNTGAIAGNIGGGGIAVGSAGFIPGTPGVPFGVSGQGNILASLDNGQLRLAISALRNLNYAKLLAEPNLTTINGQTANFRAGGQFPTPVLTGGAGIIGGLQGVEYRNYGIDIFFTPYLTDRDRIRLVLNADVTGIDITAGQSNIGGTNVPFLRQRQVNTTVELREGQTLAVAGLIQNNASGESTKIPLLGDFPILGNLFGVNRVTAGEQELVILVTPELVHPLDCKDRLPVPGHDLYEPTDFEFYILGRIEGNREFRSPIRTDWARMQQYRFMESNFIAGPSGYCDPK